MKLLGLRTIIYPTRDLAQDKVWWEDILGKEPYFDKEFYVGFDAGGYELGIDPKAELSDGPITYWGIEDVDEAVEHFMKNDCELYSEPRDTGNGITVAIVQKLYDQQLIGLIYNPHFKV